MTGISGGYAYLGYDWAGGTSWKLFGHGLKLSTHEKKNNTEVVYALGARDAQFLIGKQYEGSISVEYILSNPWIFKAILGSVTTTDNLDGTYTHVFPTSGETPQPAALDLINWVDADTADVTFTYNNCYINNTSISLNKDDVIKVSHELAYETEGYSETTTKPTISDETFNPYAFQHGTLTVGGETVGIFENFELTINHNLEPIRGLGSRFNQDVAPKQLEITGKGGILFTGASLKALYRFYNGTNTAPTGPSSDGYIEFSGTDSVVLTITNGGTGTDERSITITLSGVAIDSYSLPESPDDVMKADVDFKFKSISVSATNTTSAVP